MKALVSNVFSMLCVERGEDQRCGRAGSESERARPLRAAYRYCSISFVALDGVIKRRIVVKGQIVVRLSSSVEVGVVVHRLHICCRN